MDLAHQTSSVWVVIPAASNIDICRFFPPLPRFGHEPDQGSSILPTLSAHRSRLTNLLRRPQHRPKGQPIWVSYRCARPRVITRANPFLINRSSQYQLQPRNGDARLSQKPPKPSGLEIGAPCLHQTAVGNAESEARSTWIGTLSPPYMSESMSFTGEVALLEVGGVYWQVWCKWFRYQ